MNSLRYTDHDRRRLTAEPGDQYRSAAEVFDDDRLRLMRCNALRRLSAITQVDEPDAGPVPHNRLTHSLAVAAIGRRIAAGVGANPVVVETACLAHDLGHPPFGHTGEGALRTRARAHGIGFEANAQTLRILTRLEPGPDPALPEGGLNLTRACLDATCKYPWTPGPHRKFGAYPEDSSVLAWIRDTAPDQRLCLEAQIMEIADDIANTVDDLTTGLRSGAITLAPLTDSAQRGEFTRLARGHFTRLPAAEIDHDIEDLLHILALAAVAEMHERCGEAVIAGLGHTLTSRLVTAVTRATRTAAGPGPHRRFHTDLVVPDHVRAEIAVLEALHLHFVLRAPALRARRARQRAMIDAVFDGLLDRAPHMLDARFAAWWARADTDAARVRVVLDQIAALTDRRTVEIFRELADDGAPGARLVSVTSGRPPAR